MLAVVIKSVARQGGGQQLVLSRSIRFSRGGRVVGIAWGVALSFNVWCILADVQSAHKTIKGVPRLK
jgi:hypothetical protein